MRGLQSRLDHSTALRLQVFGKLDDQNRVLGGQPNDGDQPDLKVHVIGHATPGNAQQHAQHAQRHHQNHRQWNRPALVQRRQTQEHCQDGKAVQHQRLRTGQFFFT